eukprot:jgi/Botrbrau1/19471/Bobra.0338s0088.1
MPGVAPSVRGSVNVQTPNMLIDTQTLRRACQPLFRTPKLTTRFSNRFQASASLVGDEVCRIDGSTIQWPGQIPWLPASPQDILVPGMRKCMPLNGPGLKSAVEEAIALHGSLIGHVVLRSANDVHWGNSPGAYRAPSFLLCLPCLASIVEIETQGSTQMAVLQGEAPFAIEGIHSFANGSGAHLAISHLKDDEPMDVKSLMQSAQELEGLLQEVRRMVQQLGAQPLELNKSLSWAGKPPHFAGPATNGTEGLAQLANQKEEAVPVLQAVGPSESVRWASRLAYAALQAVPHMGPQAAFSLAGRRQAAFVTRDPAHRLRLGLELMSEARSVLAAKVAIEEALASASWD